MKIPFERLLQYFSSSVGSIQQAQCSSLYLPAFPGPNQGPTVSPYPMYPKPTRYAVVRQFATFTESIRRDYLEIGRNIRYVTFQFDQRQARGVGKSAGDGTLVPRGLGYTCNDHVPLRPLQLISQIQHAIRRVDLLRIEGSYGVGARLDRKVSAGAGTANMDPDGLSGDERTSESDQADALTGATADHPGLPNLWTTDTRPARPHHRGRR